MSAHLESPVLELLDRKLDDPAHDDGLADDVLEKLGKPKNRKPRIRCPKCAYEPRREDRWVCREGCFCSWNTFDTHGVCPDCGFRWLETACPRCHQWSAHDDWYEKPAGDEPAS